MKISDIIKFIFFDNLDKTITIVLSLFAVVISIISWIKNRAIYGIETMVLRQWTGKDQDVHGNNSENINKKLSSGKYTILSILERSKADGDWELILGKIKK